MSICVNIASLSAASTAPARVDRFWGGGINPDTDIDEYDTAGREFFEETNNSIPLYDGETCPRPDWRGISTMLREGKCASERER